MTLGQFLSQLEQAGLIVFTGKEYADGLEAWYERAGVTADTPIPVWDDDAKAWEV